MSEASQATSFALDVQYASGEEDGDPPSPTSVRHTMTAALPTSAQVTVRFASSAESQQANLRYCGKNKPANVLAFAYENEPLVGDVIICPAVVTAESHSAGIEPSYRFRHLLVHAALHLQGMTHDTPATASAMEATEARIMRQLGLPSPYAEESSA